MTCFLIKGVATNRQINRCAMKFCHFDKISTRTCIFDGAKFFFNLNKIFNTCSYYKQIQLNENIIGTRFSFMPA